MTRYLYLYQVVCICLSGSQDFIHLHCDHQEMPGKCFNLPTFIQNARTLSQATQSKYSACFWPLLWFCRTLSLFLFLSSTLASTPNSSIHCRHTQPVHQSKAAHDYCEIFIPYSIHIHNEKHISVLQSKAPNPWLRLQQGQQKMTVWTEQLLGMTARDWEAGCDCKEAHVFSTTLQYKQRF